MGRAADLGWLDEAVRLGAIVTVRGPGGMGKTTLALEWARRNAARFSEALFVDLSVARDEASVRAAFARALFVPTAPNDLLLVEQISARAGALFVVDNAEAVSEAVAALLGRLEDGPAILVTSREPLGLSIEVVRVLAPIGLADEESVEAVRASDAFALFSAAAVRARGEWSPTPREVLAAGTLCTKLDGIPLAIELAAARLGTSSLDELGRRLERGIDALGTGPRDANARHRTLRAAIEGSLALLSEPELGTVEALAAIAGSFDLEAAEAIAGRDAAEHVRALNDKSLLRAFDVRVGDGSSRRLALYDTVLAVVGERLAQRPDRALILDRHAEHFAELGDRLRHAMDGEGGGAALARATEELPNLSRALEHALTMGRPKDATTALTSLRALAPVAQAMGDAERIIVLADRVLTTFTRLSARDRALAMERRAHALYVLGRRDEGRVASDEAISLARKARDKALEARLSCTRARMMLLGTRDAVALLEEVLVLLRAHGAPRDRAMGANELACRLTELGQHDRAEVLFRESLADFNRVGDARTSGVTACQLAILDLERGRLGDARASFFEAEGFLARVGGWNLEVMVQQTRANLFHAEGDLAAAHEAYQRTEALYARVASRLFAPIFAGYRGMVLHELGDPRTAEAVLAKAARDLESAGEHQHRALVLAHLGGIAAADGRSELASAHWAASRGEAALSGARGLSLVLALTQVESLLFKARTAIADHDPRAAEAARRHAQKAIDEALAGDPARSLDVRIAERIVRRRLSELIPGASPAGGAAQSGAAQSGAPGSPGALAVHVEARWFHLGGGARVGLASQALWRRLLLALVEARLSQPGQSLSIPTLVSAGWPGEQMQETSAKNRLQVAISGLRKLGLESAIQREGDGYRIDPELEVVTQRG